MSRDVVGQRSNNMASLCHFFFRAKCFDKKKKRLSLYKVYKIQ